jgi:hypothetical protein
MHLVSKYCTIQPPPSPSICIFISPLGNSAAVFNPFTFPSSYISSVFCPSFRITFCIFCLLAYCLISLHSLLSTSRFELLLLPDLKFHFTTSLFESHSINTYIEQPAGDSYSVSYPFPLSSFFTTCQTNQYGGKIFRLPYSVLTWSSSKVCTLILKD